MNNLREKENENVLHKYSTTLFLLLLLPYYWYWRYCNRFLFVLHNALIFSVLLQFNKHAPIHTHTHTHTPVHEQAHTLYFQFSTAVTTFRDWAPSFPPDNAGNTNVWNIFQPRISTIRQLPVDRSTISKGNITFFFRPWCSG